MEAVYRSPYSTRQAVNIEGHGRFVKIVQFTESQLCWGQEQRRNVVIHCRLMHCCVAIFFGILCTTADVLFINDMDLVRIDQSYRYILKTFLNLRYIKKLLKQQFIETKHVHITKNTYHINIRSICLKDF
jgi:hypothetical protein